MKAWGTPDRFFLSGKGVSWNQSLSKAFAEQMEHGMMLWPQIQTKKQKSLSEIFRWSIFACLKLFKNHVQSPFRLATSHVFRPGHAAATLMPRPAAWALKGSPCGPCGLDPKMVHAEVGDVDSAGDIDSHDEANANHSLFYIIVLITV